MSSGEFVEDSHGGGAALKVNPETGSRRVVGDSGGGQHAVGEFVNVAKGAGYLDQSRAYRCLGELVDESLRELVTDAGQCGGVVALGLV